MTIIEFELTRGQKAIIDDKDYELIKNYKWYALKAPNTYYAVTSVRFIDGTLRQKRIYMHRLIMGVLQKQQIDHINNNGLDNRRENLRLCNHTTNSMNQIKNRGTSKYKGVYWNKNDKKWQASITLSKKKTYLGQYNSEVSAAIAYDIAAYQYFGEFAKLNFESSDWRTK